MVASYTRGLDDVPLPLQASIFRMIPAHPYETPTGLHGDPASHVLASTFLLDAPHEPLFVTRSDKVIDADYVILQSTFTNSTLLGRVVMKCPKWDVAFIKLQEPYSLDAYKQYVSEKLGGVVPEPFVAEDASHEAIEGAPVMVMGYMANQGSMLPADVEVGEGEGKLSYSPYTGPATLHGTLKDTLCSIENGVMLPHNVYVPFGTSGGPTVERNTGRVLGMSAVAYLEDEDDEMAPSEMPTFLSVFVWKLLMLARVYADNQKEEFTTIVGIPRLEKDWSKNETEMCFSEGLMKAGLASASYEEMAPLDVEIQQLREAFTDAVLRKHWDVLSVAFGMENIKKEDIDEMPAPIFFQVLHDLMYLWVNPHIHQVPARRDWVHSRQPLI
ncbi:unnamed protein product [Vitrella brassicaformis CCMP3155]|uniref:Uncharacterized protein n=1 Tax=Vitrella brassicaformis (strain CCMP3155) TaxID=1169540 RepID=A0A0G4FVM9_VITBC|nr:unnamed protein product [Vitrella brassicaformis CCMP3155]|eukprot:CEM18604.1 unnamed protein product [Vitrella brassicaformis CCMP3155]